MKEEPLISSPSDEEIEAYRTAQRHSWLTAYSTTIQTIVTCGALIWGFILYYNDINRRHVDFTLQYIAPLQQREFSDALWNLTEIIQCHERTSHYAISFEKFEKVTAADRIDRTRALIKNFYDLVENDDRYDYCNKKVYFTDKKLEMEHQLFTVFQGLESLASCIESDLCDKNTVINDIPLTECVKLKNRWETFYTLPLSKLPVQNRLIETFDYQSVLGVSNYLLLSRLGSREWDGSAGNLPSLIQKIQSYSDCLGFIQSNKDLFRRERRWGPPA